MHYGPFSERFRYFDCSVNSSWLCLVVEFPDRTVDLLCKDIAQVTALCVRLSAACVRVANAARVPRVQLERWFFGLQNLAPLNSTHLTRGAVLWARANMKVRLCARHPRRARTRARRRSTSRRSSNAHRRMR